MCKVVQGLLATGAMQRAGVWGAQEGADHVHDFGHGAQHQRTAHGQLVPERLLVQVAAHGLLQHA